MANETRRTKDRQRAKAKGPRPLSLKARKAARDKLAAMDNPILFFGKYKGQHLSEVPQDYLAWLANNMTDATSLRMEGLMVAVKRYLGIETQGGTGRPNGSSDPVPCPGDRTPRTAKAGRAENLMEAVALGRSTVARRNRSLKTPARRRTRMGCRSKAVTEPR